MHILIIPSWYPVTPVDPGGSFFREQAQALVRNGCRVGVIYPQHRSLRQWTSAFIGKYGISEESDVGLTTLRYHGMNWFPRFPIFGGRYWVRHAEKLYIDYIKKYGKPDLIHAHSLLHAGRAALHISRLSGVPFVVTEHSSAFTRGLVIGKQLRNAAKAVHGASRLIAVSEDFCNVLGRVFPESAGQWMYVPNVVHERFLEAPLRVRRDNPFTFLHVSTLEPGKAVGNLIDAYAAAFGMDINTHMVIGGHGVERDELENRVKRHGIDKCVSFVGALSRDGVLKQMQECDAFVLSSKAETFGVVLIEALALGKPVVATRCGGPESIIREEDGILVPVDDVPKLGDGMKEIRRQYGNYRPIELRRSCANRFSEKAVTRQLIDIYRQVLAEPKRHTAA